MVSRSSEGHMGQHRLIFLLEKSAEKHEQFVYMLIWTCNYAKCPLGFQFLTYIPSRDVGVNIEEKPANCGFI